MANTYRITVGGNDITDYIVDRFQFSNTNSDAIPDGFFSTDDNSPFTLNYGDEVYFYITPEGGSEFKKFGGYITTQEGDAAVGRKRRRCVGFAQKAKITDFTGNFRDDQASGNMKDIIIAILDEKFPDWTYDDTSIPDIDIDFIVKRFNDADIDTIFDDFARRANRVWGVDKNKKFFFKSREFTEVSSIIQEAVNTWGNITEDIEDERFGNIIKVYGARFAVPVTDEFSGDGTKQEFTLSVFPTSAVKAEYTDGTVINMALEGAENYDDPNFFDAYCKPESRIVQFNVNTTSGTGNIIIRNEIFSQIREEIPFPDSIERNNGIEKTIKINDDKITTQEDAFEICKLYGEANGDPVTVFTVNTYIESQNDLEHFTSGNNVQFIKTNVDSRFNIVKDTVNGSKPGGINFSVSLNDTPVAAVQRLDSFLKRIRQREEKELFSGDIITKTFYWSGNIYIKVDSIAVDVQNADDGTFVMQESDFDDRSLMEESPAGASVMREDYLTAPVVSVVQNANNIFKHLFIDDFFIDATNSNGVLDKDNAKYILDDTEILQSKTIQNDGSDYSSATLADFSSYSTVDVYVKNENTSFTLMTSATLIMSSPGEDYKYKIENSSGSTFDVISPEFAFV